MEIGQSAGKTWAYIVGVYLGDGCVTRQKKSMVFRLNTIDEDFARAVKAALETHTKAPISIHCYPVKKSSKPNWALRCGDENISCLLITETNNKKQLPSWIWSCDHETRLAFIAGLMDSEGYVCQIKKGRHNQPRPDWHSYMGFKSTDVWFDDFIRVLNKAGITVGKVGVEKPRKEGYRTPRRFSINMAAWVKSGAYFNIARKQNRVEKWAAKVTSETNTRNAA